MCCRKILSLVVAAAFLFTSIDLNGSPARNIHDNPARHKLAAPSIWKPLENEEHAVSQAVQFDVLLGARLLYKYSGDRERLDDVNAALCRMFEDKKRGWESEKKKEPWTKQALDLGAVRFTDCGWKSQKGRSRKRELWAVFTFDNRPGEFFRIICRDKEDIPDAIEKPYKLTHEDVFVESDDYEIEKVSPEIEERRASLGRESLDDLERDKDNYETVFIGLMCVDKIHDAGVDKLIEGMNPDSLALAGDLPGSIDKTGKKAASYTARLPDAVRRALSSPEALISGGPAASSARISEQISKNGNTRVSLITSIGSDAIGRKIKEAHEKLGVDMAKAYISDKDTAYTLVFEHGDGRRSFLHNAGASADLTIGKLKQEYFKGEKVAEFGGVELTGLMPDLAAALRMAKDEGCITVLDTVADPAHQWKELRLEEVLQQVDLFTPSIEEARQIMADYIYKGNEEKAEAEMKNKELNPEQLVQFFIGRGAKAVFLKNGKDGAYVRTTRDSIFKKKDSFHIPILRGFKDVSGTGTGDAFAGAAVYALAHDWNAEKAALFASVVGGMCVQYKGGTIGDETLADALYYMERLKAEMQDGAVSDSSPQSRASASGSAAIHNPYEGFKNLIASVGHEIGLDEKIIASLQDVQEERMGLHIQVKMDNGKMINFPLYVSLHNDALGPKKGGISIGNKDVVYPDEIRAKSGWMTIKLAIADFKKRGYSFSLGGGKSGIVLPEGLTIDKMSEGEVEQLARGYVKELYRAGMIGPKIYIPAPDIGLDTRWSGKFMNWIADEYQALTGTRAPEVVTGKPVTGDAVDGMRGREGATEEGGLYILQELMSYLDELSGKFKALKGFSDTLKGKTVAVQGAGKVGTIAQLLHREGAQVISWSDIEGALYDKEGLNISKLAEYRAYGSFLRDAEGFPKVGTLKNGEMLELDVDILVLAATDNVITEENADRIKAKVVLCLANGPITPEAEKILTAKGILILPDVLANIGGVTVSFFEMLQNIEGRPWTFEETKDKLRKIMNDSLRDVVKIAQVKDVSLTRAAYMLAEQKIVEAMPGETVSKGYVTKVKNIMQASSDSAEELREKVITKFEGGEMHLIFVRGSILGDQDSTTTARNVINHWEEHYNGMEEKYTAHVVDTLKELEDLLASHAARGGGKARWDKSNTIVALSIDDIRARANEARLRAMDTKFLSVEKATEGKFVPVKTIFDLMAALVRINKPLDRERDGEIISYIGYLLDKIVAGKDINKLVEALTSGEFFENPVKFAANFIIKLLPRAKKFDAKQLKELYEASKSVKVSS